MDEKYRSTTPKDETRVESTGIHCRFTTCITSAGGIPICVAEYTKPSMVGFDGQLLKFVAPYMCVIVSLNECPASGVAHPSPSNVTKTRSEFGSKGSSGFDVFAEMPKISGLSWLIMPRR
eukprot:Amastigsp_a2209_55.p6 type:complete len:120 gc:universal Amastigsp_a2209_55:538-179(-)